MKSLLKRNKRTFLFAFSAVLTIFILPVVIPALFVFSPAVAQTQITIATSVPGTYGAAASAGAPGAYVADFYWFALIIGGVLAFGVVVYGGVRYMASAGNPSGQSDAKEWIEAAILGLLLLVGVYFVLSVINPQLLNLNLPSLTPVNISSIVVPSNPIGSANGPNPRQRVRGRNMRHIAQLHANNSNHGEGSYKLWRYACCRGGVELCQSSRSKL